jgi:hypothetical protein
MSMLFVVESPELFVEPVLCLDGDGHDVGRLSLASALENEIGTTAVAVVPGSLDKDAPAVGVARLSNGSPSFPLAGRSLTGHQPKVGHQGPRGAKAMYVVDLAQQRHGGECLHSSQTTERLDIAAIRRCLGVANDLIVEYATLGLEILEVFELGGECGVHRPIKFVPQTSEALAMGFRPLGFTFVVDMSVVEQHPGDTMLGRSDIADVLVTQTDQTSQGFLLPGRHVDRGEMTAAKEPDKVDGVEAIGLAALAGLPRNE